MTSEKCPSCKGSIPLDPFDPEVQCPSCKAWFDVFESPVDFITLTPRGEAPPQKGIDDV